MNKFFAGTALAVVALSAAPAAAEAPFGPRVEIHAGADIERLKLDRPDTDGITVKVNDTGILYGLGIGYDFPISDMISLGAEASLDRSTAKLEKTFLDIDGEDEFDLELRAKPRWIGFLGARASFAVSDTSNFYVNGGYTRVGYRARARAIDRADGDVIASERDSDRVGGWRVGAGAQVDFGTNTYFGGEVNYSNLKDDFSRIGLQLALGYRFGARPAEVVEVAPAPVPAPAPEPAPATQTCADGSVILATDMCPAPAPVPAPERG